MLCLTFVCLYMSIHIYIATNWQTCTRVNKSFFLVLCLNSFFFLLQIDVFCSIKFVSPYWNLDPSIFSHKSLTGCKWIDYVEIRLIKIRSSIRSRTSLRVSMLRGSGIWLAWFLHNLFMYNLHSGLTFNVKKN